jgi:hypothetical protein
MNFKTILPVSDKINLRWFRKEYINDSSVIDPAYFQ